ncbi:MAG TPA: HepT-like ribonuclease domain-containing protein [Phycisphaerae bacterium]|nr:HepT-like ribonuclease domain-containing protein [Phycisphaerae bacterium]
MPMSDRDRMIHMLDYAEKTAGIARNRRREELEQDTTLLFALLHGVQTVGEAAAAVSEQGRLAYPTVRWRQIISMRNRLVHGYDSVNCDILWETVQTHVPELIEELLKFIPPEQT